VSSLDLQHHRKWVASLDGIRAIAALLVLGSHTFFINVIYGTAGVWLFFVLSAFLLTQPFLKKDAVLSIWSVYAFYIRRIFRIMPMYAVFVIAFGLILKGAPYIRDNLLLFRGNDHLWTINQEMTFYLIMPVFIAAMFPFRRYPTLCIAALVATGAVSDKYLTAQRFELPALTGHSVFYVSLFFLGMAAAVAVPTFSRLSERLKSGFATNLTSIAIVVLAIVPHVYAARTFAQTSVNIENGDPLLMGATFVPLLIWVSVCPDNWLTKFLSFNPLRVVGRAAFSFYLIQGAALAAFNGSIPIGWPAFVCATLVTVACSIATFHLIERPGIRLGNWIISYFYAREGNVTASIPASAPIP
jgi:peptidoglycan/LPS O-acetylase OafA/YrhL